MSKSKFLSLVELFILIVFRAVLVRLMHYYKNNSTYKQSHKINVISAIYKLQVKYFNKNPYENLIIGEINIKLL